MQRLRIEPDAISNDRVSFGPEQAHQLRAVLRARPGHRVVAVEFGAAEYLVELVEVDRSRAWGRIVAARQVTETPGTPVTLAPAVLREQKMDLVVQKAAELGVHRIQPVLAARSVARPPAGRADRWQRIAVEAAEQCGRGTVPRVDPAANLAQVLAADPCDGDWWLDESARDLGLSSLLSRPAPTSIRVFVGPEGGFDQAERKLFFAAGTVGVGMGPLVLRSETAAIAVLSAISLEFGALGEPAADRSWPAGVDGPDSESGDGIQSPPGG